MKRLLLILILTFSFQSLTKADAISDFEIEGMNVGSSLLEYFSKKKIKEFINDNRSYFYKKGDYVIIGIYKGNQKSITLNNYRSLGITTNKKDNKYKILSIAGQNYSYEDMNDCSTAQASIASDIKKDVIENSVKESTWKNDKYESGGTIVGKSKMHDFVFSDNSALRIICYELNDEESIDAGWKVKMEVIINSKEFHEFLIDP